MEEKSIMNPAFEQELRKVLEEVYKNRMYLEYSDLSYLRNTLATKKGKK